MRRLSISDRIPLGAAPFAWRKIGCDNLNKISFQYGSMHATSSAEESAMAMLKVIESAYDVDIRNKREVVEAMTDVTEDEQAVLMICTALNTWVAMNLSGREIVIPPEVVSRIAERVIGGY